MNCCQEHKHKKKVISDIKITLTTILNNLHVWTTRPSSGKEAYLENRPYFFYCLLGVFEVKIFIGPNFRRARVIVSEISGALCTRLHNYRRILYGKRAYLYIRPCLWKSCWFLLGIRLSKGCMLTYAFGKQKTSENLRYILVKRM